MDVLEAIYSRRSVRNFSDSPVGDDQAMEILKAGSWAPSGLNNQPWRFVLIRDGNMRAELSRLTRYGRILEEAPLAIAVLIDSTVMYNDTKDHQAIGACLQNMLLAVHAMGLGAVWLGEILKSADEVRRLLDLPSTIDLMAVVAVGHPSRGGQRSERKPVEELLLKVF